METFIKLQMVKPTKCCQEPGGLLDLSELPADKSILRLARMLGMILKATDHYVIGTSSWGELQVIKYIQTEGYLRGKYGGGQVCDSNLAANEFTPIATSGPNKSMQTN